MRTHDLADTLRNILINLSKRLDDDLQEALINVTAGMSFCLRVSAAQAAGFYHTDLLTRNAKEAKQGQMVVEMPDCKDLVLAPEYDLGRRLLALEAQEMAQARQSQRRQAAPFLTPAHGHHRTAVQQPMPRFYASIPPLSSGVSNVSESGNTGNDPADESGQVP